MLTLEEREILSQLILIGEECWDHLAAQYESATGEELSEESYDSMKSKLEEF